MFVSPDIGESIEKALRKLVERHIFLRGEGYFGNGKVADWRVTGIGPKTLRIHGVVEGSDEYDTTLDFDLDAKAITRADCSCPYELGCKHMVAVGLQLAELCEDYAFDPEAHGHGNITSLRDGIVESAGEQGVPPETRPEEMSEEAGRAKLLSELAALGIDPRRLPEETIEKLFAAKRPPKPASSRVSAPRSVPRFKPSVYLIRLTRNLTPQFCRRQSYGYYSRIENASIAQALAASGITPSQRNLLEAIRDGRFDASKHSERDLSALVGLLKESGFRVAFDYGEGPVSFVTEPKAKIEAAICYRPSARWDNLVSHQFFLEMPAKYWRGRASYAHSFVSGGTHVAYVTGKTITLYPLTPLLGAIIARVREHWDGGRPAGYLAKLTGSEIERYEEIARDAAKYLNLSEPPPEFRVERSSGAEPCFAVDYDSVNMKLSAAAMMDYGCLLENVGERIHWSMAGGVKHLARRRDYFEGEETHIVQVSEGVIRIAPINAKKEAAFFKEAGEHSEEIGFTKTLVCSREGERRIAEYAATALPGLKKFAAKRGYPVRFVRDPLAFEQATFRADFAVELDADRDWLSFDIDCYCGEERVTLQTLLAFIERGETSFRRADGTFIEIANRESLERLARMLRSFEARENGFEGRLYHAAELGYILTSSPHYNAERAKSFETFLKKAEAGKPVAPVRIPAHFAKVLRPYQKEGVEWLYFLRSYRFAGILADDMGLGKTLQALTVLSAEKVQKRPSIVICPKSLLHNWRNEAAKYAPDLKVLVYEGTPLERAKMARQFGKYDLVVAGYAALKKDEARFADPKVRFNYAVLDEAQFIKNHATKSAQIAKRLNADYRLALTGTPLENSVSELWSVFDFLMPGFLGSYKDFSERFHKPIMDKGEALALEHLRRKIAPFLLRRTKQEVLPELPQKIEQQMTCELGDAQNVLYQQILAKVRSDVFGAVEKKGFKSAQIHILAGLTKLRQTCNHPALLLDERGRKKWRTYESAKLDLAFELVEEAVEGGHKTLLFSQFTSMLDIIAEGLKDRGIEHVYLSGATRDRQSLIERFNADPKVSVFLISLKAGGTGLNLTAADTVIVFDPWWNPSVEAQAVDRAHRIGQKKSVNVYRLIVKGTIEEKIQSLKAKKKALTDAIVDESGDLFRKLTWDDIRQLFA